MAWTYTSDPENVPRDAVRLLIGDTIQTDQQLADSEIAYFLTQATNSVMGAAIRATRALLARYARLVDKAVGDLRLSYSQRQAAYAALLAELEAALAKGPTVSPFAGGISVTDILGREADVDRPRPDFVRGDDDGAPVRGDGRRPGWSNWP